MLAQRFTDDVPRPALERAPRTRVRSWTGRAAMSLLTDSELPTLVTAGTRCTRVSGMRLAARAGEGDARRAPAGPVTTAQVRPSRRPLQHHRSG